MKKVIILLSAVLGPVVLFAQLDPANTYLFKSNVVNNRMLTGGNPLTSNPEAVCLYTGIETLNNSWKVEPTPGGFYKIRNTGTDKYLAVSGGSLVAGDPAILWTDQGQADIQWKIIPVSTSRTTIVYKVKNKKSNLYLAVEGGSTTNGAQVLQWEDQGQPDIFWKIEGKLSIEGRKIGGPENESSIMTKAQWQPIFTRILSGFQININNYAPDAYETTRSNVWRFARPNDCYIRFDGQQHRFPMQPFRMDPATIYFINLTSRPPSIVNNGRELLIEMDYNIRSDYEILANCVDNIVCGDGMWWINLTRMKMYIYLMPVIEDGKIAFSNPRVRVAGAISSAGSNAVVENFNNGALFNKIATQILQQLNFQEVKQFFNNNFHIGLLREMRGMYGTDMGTRGLPYTRVTVQTNGDIKFER